MFRRLLNQFIRFAGVGTVAFIIDYVLLIALTELVGLYYLASATISFIASVVFNYAMSMRVVFTHRQDLSRRREFIIFAVLSAIGLVLNNVGMYVGTSIIGVDYRITKILATMCVALFNFFTRRAFLDGQNRERKLDKKREREEALRCEREARNASGMQDRGSSDQGVPVEES